jgi:hypothetical protein
LEHCVVEDQGPLVGHLSTHQALRQPYLRRDRALRHNWLETCRTGRTWTALGFQHPCCSTPEDTFLFLIDESHEALSRASWKLYNVAELAEAPKLATTNGTVRTQEKSRSPPTSINAHGDGPLISSMRRFSFDLAIDRRTAQCAMKARGEDGTRGTFSSPGNMAA